MARPKTLGNSLMPVLERLLLKSDGEIFRRNGARWRGPMRVQVNGLATEDTILCTEAESSTRNVPRC